MSLTRTIRFGMASVVAIAIVTLFAAPAMAQQPAAADPNPGNITVTTGADLLNAYMFRGIRRNVGEVAFWPYVDLGLALYSGDGGLKSVALNVGSWNSLHTDSTGSNNPRNSKLWYEGDFYSTLSLGLGQGVTFGTTFTAYTSPNDAFTTVKELAFKVGMDDRAYLGTMALNPYVLVALELDATYTPAVPAIPAIPAVPGVPPAPGVPGVPGRPGIPYTASGQLDAGSKPGRYLELGVAPTWAAPSASVMFPIKVGLGLNYYEMNRGTPIAPVWVDTNFGYLSAAAIATVPLGGTTSFGAWNVHGGIEFQVLGDMTEELNRSLTGRVDASKVLIGSVGFGLSY